MKQRKPKALVQHGRKTVVSSLPGVPAFLRKPAQPYNLSQARSIGFLPVLGEHPSNPDVVLRSLAQTAGVKLFTFDK